MRKGGIKMSKKFKCTGNIVLFILVMVLLAGCTFGKSQKKQEKIDVQDIRVDTNEVEIDAKGVELLGMDLTEGGVTLFNIVTSIKNNSNNDCDIMLNLEFYDKNDSVIDSRSDIGIRIGPGEIWNSRMFESNDRGIAKIKVTKISANPTHFGIN